MKFKYLIPIIAICYFSMELTYQLFGIRYPEPEYNKWAAISNMFAYIKTHGAICALTGIFCAVFQDKIIKTTLFVWSAYELFRIGYFIAPLFNTHLYTKWCYSHLWGNIISGLVLISSYVIAIKIVFNGKKGFL